MILHFFILLRNKRDLIIVNGVGHSLLLLSVSKKRDKMNTVNNLKSLLIGVRAIKHVENNNDL